MAKPQFSDRMRSDRVQRMWTVWCSGEEMDVAGAAVGLSRKTVFNRIAETGGVRPRRGRTQSRARLSFEDRCYVEAGLRQGRSIRAIAADLGRSPSTISREVRRGTGTSASPSGSSGSSGYRAERAHANASAAAERPQAAKLDADPVLRERVLRDLGRKYSPEQIAGRLREDFPNDPDMNIHHETIYRWVYLQARGTLRREVKAALRSGRARRVPNKHGRSTGQGHIPGMVSIHDRPPVEVEKEVDGETTTQRLSGHWEGDLIIGRNNQSQIGTVVERATGYVLLIHLPNGQSAEHLAEALTPRLAGLPDHLRQSLTWDQGKEMAQHAKVRIDAGIEVYFADPHTPWHRPSNENTNGLLRQYFPKGTDLSVHTATDLARVEAELNDRPRKRLDYAKPEELMTRLLLDT